jgi:hypothetical protein
MSHLPDDATAGTTDDATAGTADDGTESDAPGSDVKEGETPESDPDGGEFLLSERDTDEGLLVAVCDAGILGDTFENGAVSLTVTEEFYGGDPADEEAVIASLRGAQVANVVGERAVEVAIAAGVVDAETVLDIGETRHAQLVRL